MDDLIRKSAVIDVLKQTGIIQDNDLGHLVVEEINRIPAAYDVEKVCKELFMESQFVCDYNMVELDLADEIVRKGGVENA